MGLFLTVSSAPSSQGEDGQVKQRRIQPTKHAPTQTVQPDIASSTEEHKHVDTPVVPTRSQPVRHCKNTV